MKFRYVYNEIPFITLKLYLMCEGMPASGSPMAHPTSIPFGTFSKQQFHLEYFPFRQPNVLSHHLNSLGNPISLPVFSAWLDNWQRFVWLFVVVCLWRRQAHPERETHTAIFLSTNMYLALIILLRLKCVYCSFTLVEFVSVTNWKESNHFCKK